MHIHQRTSSPSVGLRPRRRSIPSSRSGQSSLGTVAQILVRIEMALSQFPRAGWLPTDSFSFSPSRSAATTLRGRVLPCRMRSAVCTGRWAGFANGWSGSRRRSRGELVPPGAGFTPDPKRTQTVWASLAVMERSALRLPRIRTRSKSSRGWRGSGASPRGTARRSPGSRRSAVR